MESLLYSRVKSIISRVDSAKRKQEPAQSNRKRKNRLEGYSVAHDMSTIDYLEIGQRINHEYYVA